MREIALISFDVNDLLPNHEPLVHADELGDAAFVYQTPHIDEDGIISFEESKNKNFTWINNNHVSVKAYPVYQLYNTKYAAEDGENNVKNAYSFYNMKYNSTEELYQILEYHHIIPNFLHHHVPGFVSIHATTQPIWILDPTHSEEGIPIHLTQLKKYLPTKIVFFIYSSQLLPLPLSKVKKNSRSTYTFKHINQKMRGKLSANYLTYQNLKRGSYLIMVFYSSTLFIQTLGSHLLMEMWMVIVCNINSGCWLQRFYYLMKLKEGKYKL